MKVGIIGPWYSWWRCTKSVNTWKGKYKRLKSNSWVRSEICMWLEYRQTIFFDFDKNILITDYNKIINDPEVDIVIELIGGETLAKTIILDAFRARKNVVTANKALIAKHGVELSK